MKKIIIRIKAEYEGREFTDEVLMEEDRMSKEVIQQYMDVWLRSIMLLKDNTQA